MLKDDSINMKRGFNSISDHEKESIPKDTEFCMIKDQRKEEKILENSSDLNKAFNTPL
jgi:hypothetical protein